MSKYYNYHKHDHKGNPVSLDVVVKLEDYCKRAIELGHDTIFTTCHGLQGDLFEATTLAHQYNLKLIVGAELYYVPDRKEKDRSNRHIIIIALNHNGIRELNNIISKSFIDGMYYKPRIDEELLFSLNPENVVVTTACVAGVWNDERLVALMKNYFKEHLFLEVQNHNEKIQKEVNKKVLELSEKYDIKIIHANDSHYINPDDAKYRESFLKAKGITYPEESNFILDYPDYDTIVERYKKQNILNEKQIFEALNNTLIFEGIDCSDYINDDIKLPSISDNPNEDLKKILNESWNQNKNIIPKEKRKDYLDSIRYEMDIIEKTNMANYFLIDYYISKIAKEKYGGVLTKTGRGCFQGDALVYTLEGMKLLKDVQVGDFVITEDGKFNKVLNTFCYNIEEPMLQIKHLYGTDKYYPTICTLDHKILIYRNNRREWIEAQNINKNDYVCVPKIKFEDKELKIIDLNNYNDFGYKVDKEYIYEEYNDGNIRYNKKIKEDSDYYYLPIKELKMIEKSPTKVYDLEVENNHSYLINNMIVHNSAPSFYITNLLHLTNIDRLASPIKLFPTRFMSIERILGAKSLPDIDLNTADAEPFIKASQDLLGEDNCAWMISWKPLQESSAFRLYCKSLDLDFEKVNEVGKDLDKYRDSEEWKQIIEDSKPFIGVIEGISESPCSICLHNKNIKEEIGMIKTPNGKICCMLDGYNCDKYKYLKNDYLTVTVWAIIRDVCKLANIEIPSINELNELLDEKTFDIYKNGLTCSINQADSDYATNLVMKYKPQSLAEMSAFVAIIRPGCASLLDDFISRKPYTTGVDALDNILEDSEHRLIYQESIMKYLIWLGISEPQSYDVIKKIAKKKFKEPELKELKSQLLEGWHKQVGEEAGFEETWKVVEDAAKYSFNACVSGDTIIQRAGSTKSKKVTIKEMFDVYNNEDYAKKIGKISLYRKYKRMGYGNALSMYDDERVRKNQIVNIYYSGKADIYRVTTENGSYLDCTLNHKFPTDKGKKRLDELKIGDELYVLDKYGKHLVKKSKIVSIKFLRNDDVYDIEMASPAHNFISDTGLITSNSHSLSYAYDSLYGAYLKSHYPLEYYTVALNYYQNDIDRTMKLTKELSYFGITLNNAKFRYSKDDYFMDKESNKIYKGTSSIKFLNRECSNYLYSLKNNKYNNFIDLLVEITNAKDEDNKSYINSKQMEILIQLQYFEEFGKNKKLLDIYKYFKDIYGRKIIAKDKLEELNLTKEDIDGCYAKETDKQYGGIDCLKILSNVEKRIPDENIPIKEQISFEKDIVGYISATYDVDKKLCLVLKVDKKYSPKVDLYSLKSGKIVKCKINKLLFDDYPLKEGDVIKCISFMEKDTVKKQDGKWVKTGQKEWWLNAYKIEGDNL